MLETDVVVIGGGVTGAAVLWDLALRGIPAVLVERDDLGTGTSGRWHGQLHSGGRYAVKDQRSARECVEDNRVLRHIAPHTIEDTGGIMVLLDDHDQAFGDRFVAGCAATGIPCEEIPPAEARRAEPALTDRIARTFRMPTDGGMDSWKLIWSFARGAQELGGRVLTRHPVTGFEQDQAGRVTAVRVHDRAAGEDRLIGCSWVINAAGAWAGRIGRMAGLPITMIPGKGTMVVMASRYVRSVISHCRMPTDGDIIVPAHEAAILGTTSTQAPDADDVTVDPDEVDLLVDEGARLVPAIAGGRVLRAFTGQRPLYQPEATGDELEEGESSREVSRTFTVLDHEQRDGVANLLSIVGGKLTTCRAMAEAVVDTLVAKRGLDAPCRTETTPLPGAGAGIHQLAHPLGEVERSQTYGQLICECELVTRSTLDRALDAGVTSLDDLRRQHRFGFGPCQAAFCGWRGAALLAERHPATTPPTTAPGPTPGTTAGTTGTTTGAAPVPATGDTPAAPGTATPAASGAATGVGPGVAPGAPAAEPPPGPSPPPSGAPPAATPATAGTTAGTTPGTAGTTAGTGTPAAPGTTTTATGVAAGTAARADAGVGTSPGAGAGAGGGGPALDPFTELHAFMQERWRGQRTAVWGGGAVQALLNHAIYRGVLALHAVAPARHARAETAPSPPATPGPAPVAGQPAPAGSRGRPRDMGEGDA